MSRPWSLRGRLVRRVVLGASLAWIAGVGLAALVIAHEMSELMDETLEGSARFSLDLYRGTEDVEALTRSTGTVRIIEGGLERASAPWPPLSQDGGQDVPGWRVFRLTDPQSQVVVEVGQSDEWRRDELLESLGGLVALMLPVLLAALVAVRGAVASALQPATRFAQVLRNRSAQDLSPVEEDQLPTELAPIPQALNTYLDDIRARIEAERQFATNAAHELRTPVAAASGQAQLIAAGLADASAPERLTGALGRMSNLIDRLLHLSRAEAGAAGRGPSDLVRVARMVAADLDRPVLVDDGEIEALPVPADPDALALILRNLLRNAADHGTGTPRIVLSPAPALTISNAVPPGASFRHGMFDKSAASTGAGLGLAIVTRVAQAQGIAVDYAIADGTASVTVRFPPGPGTPAA
ncbi:histidine kinase dimerization/phospho-acceptor domain-containing protein [Paracoccus sp. WLY502]|uniref:histidine kinase dimerization/phospho-acceptor domain-containing protein n=1 Tax=Paracoccus yibinensis TaxID=3068891 RepID=UPI002796A800|nr:histidine kinase dimerization/phospho-acceptor domain-containing protein [Paracoccus sp. WLY502]MDQ1899585.1 histidine kinase dimerization/phospho-acceptor domain-containing protein [Paracoccus sp. WLY502]